MNKTKIETISITSQRGNRYVYDPSTNLIFPDTFGFSRIVKEYGKFSKEQIIARLGSRYGRDEITRNYNYIDTLVKKFDAFHFKNKTAGNPVIGTQAELDNYVANINQIVLEVSQACNLRCKYCVFSGNYEDYRTHNSQYMKEEIAIKSIDRFISYIGSEKRTRKFGRVFINFFGGEPLLNIDLIRKCVNYARSRFRTEKIKEKLHFSISTNGMLLKENILSYLIENEFLLAISLDGPKEEHDKNRVTTVGKGSFDVVWSNLNKMRESNSLYFKNYVVFLITLSPNHDPLNIDRFFRTVFTNGHSRLRVSMLIDGDYSQQNSQFKQKFKKLKKEIFNNKFLDLSFSPFLSTFLAPLYKSVLTKKFLGYPDHFTAACFPDNFRVFVSSTGEYHICERINPNFSIGNYKKGILIEKVKKIYEDYNEQVIKKRCNSCAAKNFCSLCFASTASGSRFDASKSCEEQIKLMKSNIYDIVSIYEENPTALAVPDSKTEEDKILDEAFY